MKRIVLSLDDGDKDQNPELKREKAKAAAASIVDLAEAGYAMAVVYGSHQLTEMIHLAMRAASESHVKTPAMPLPECGAMSQGYDGYHLQNAIGADLVRRGLSIAVSTVITQVVVEEGADCVCDQSDSPSFKPIEIVEAKTICHLIDAGQIVLAAGGGGIPVLRRGCALTGVSTLVDKSSVCARLGETIKADVMVVVTDSPSLVLKSGEMKTAVDRMTPDQAMQNLCDFETEGAEKRKKIEAAVRFVSSGEGRKALFTSLDKVKAGLNGEDGTWITNN